MNRANIFQPFNTTLQCGNSCANWPWVFISKHTWKQISTESVALPVYIYGCHMEVISNSSYRGHFHVIMIYFMCNASKCKQVIFCTPSPNKKKSPLTKGKKPYILCGKPSSNIQAFYGIYKNNLKTAPLYENLNRRQINIFLQSETVLWQNISDI